MPLSIHPACPPDASTASKSIGGTGPGPNAFKLQQERLERHRLEGNAFYQQQVESRRIAPPLQLHPALRRRASIGSSSPVSSMHPSVVNCSTINDGGSVITTMSPFIDSDPRYIYIPRQSVKDGELRGSSESNACKSPRKGHVGLSVFPRKDAEDNEHDGLNKNLPKKGILDRLKKLGGLMNHQDTSAIPPSDIPPKAQAVLGTGNICADPSITPQTRSSLHTSLGKGTNSARTLSCDAHGVIDAETPCPKNQPSNRSTSRRLSFLLEDTDSSTPPTPPAKNTPPSQNCNNRQNAGEYRGLGVSAQAGFGGPNVYQHTKLCTAQASPATSSAFGRRSSPKLITRPSLYSLHASIVPESIDAAELQGYKSRMDGLNIEGFNTRAVYPNNLYNNQGSDIRVGGGGARAHDTNQLARMGVGDNLFTMVHKHLRTASPQSANTSCYCHMDPGYDFGYPSDAPTSSHGKAAANLLSPQRSPSATVYTHQSAKPSPLCVFPAVPHIPPPTNHPLRFKNSEPIKSVNEPKTSSSVSGSGSNEPQPPYGSYQDVVLDALAQIMRNHEHSGAMWRETRNQLMTLGHRVAALEHQHHSAAAPMPAVTTGHDRLHSHNRGSLIACDSASALPYGATAYVQSNNYKVTVDDKQKDSAQGTPLHNPSGREIEHGGAAIGDYINASRESPAHSATLQDHVSDQPVGSSSGVIPSNEGLGSAGTPSYCSPDNPSNREIMAMMQKILAAVSNHDSRNDLKKGTQGVAQ
ncbi:hypothetical protein K470DRAFT_273413 [Piedraia hortae CBS 480.64]|uniref:Uncharacterized protein n=1 Tax=Piedraia hortae CBS 480.64 TaxID=1314780 RepID=A0A6A7BRG1_9PEZI|nr:hypothetical protein K470DRAFT_273413 [Piedraia hortae CBS 480.64]